jgi:hypothetical protein
MDSERKRGGWGQRVAVAFALLTLYLLSVGPVFWLACHGYISFDTFRQIRDTFYLPLTWCYYQSEWFAEHVEWYLDFFGDFARRNNFPNSKTQKASPPLLALTNSAELVPSGSCNLSRIARNWRSQGMVDCLIG